LQDYKEYSSCQGCRAIPSLVNIMASINSQHSTVGKAAVSALLYTLNQGVIVSELLQGLGSNDRATQEAAGPYSPHLLIVESTEKYLYCWELRNNESTI
jgi:hypothetical protein